MKEYKKCPICEGTDFKEVLKCKDYTVSDAIFTIVACSKCSFQFTNPIPLESEIGTYYESEDYISHSNSKKGIINSLYQFVRNITLEQKLKLIKNESKGQKLLDIGSGTGEFLNHCNKAGFNGEGIEPSEQARNYAIENYDLKVGDEEKINAITKESFDVITMWHVLEHVYHLNERIKQIDRILKKEGVLIVAVPNRTSYDATHYKEHWAAYDVPRHLYHFTPNDIKNVFEKHGFILEKINPMKFDSFYVSMLSEKYKEGKTNLSKAFNIARKSNQLAKRNKKNTYSSQIYILRKN